MAGFSGLNSSGKRINDKMLQRIEVTMLEELTDRARCEGAGEELLGMR